MCSNPKIIATVLMFLLTTMGFSQSDCTEICFFPLQIGNTWHYEYGLPDWGAAKSAQVFDTTRIDGKLYFAYGEYSEYPSLIRADSLGRIWRKTPNSEVLWLDTTLEDGGTYEVNLSEVGTPYIVTVKRNISIETFAGRFDNCIEFFFNDTLSFDEEQWFTLAPGVGIIRDQIASVTKLLSSAIIDGQVITEINSDEKLPFDFRLNQNFPNPFNPTTKIEYQIPIATNINLSIYTITGEKIRTLVRTRQQPGTYTAVWNGNNENERPVASGIYVYRLKAGEYILSRKLLLLK